jgi:hypothetical protein
MNIFPVQNLTKMDIIKQYKLQQSKIHLQLESMDFQKILHFLFFYKNIHNFVLQSTFK